MAQPHYPHHGRIHQQTVVTVVQGGGGGGCLKGLGMGTGLIFGCIGAAFLAFIFSGVVCAKVASSAGSAMKEAAARAEEAKKKRQEEDAKHTIIVRWKLDDSVLRRASSPPQTLDGSTSGYWWRSRTMATTQFP